MPCTTVPFLSSIVTVSLLSFIKNLRKVWISKKEAGLTLQPLRRVSQVRLRVLLPPAIGVYPLQVAKASDSR